MFVKQLDMLGDIAVVEVSDPEIQQDIEQESKIEQVHVKSVIRQPHRVLNGPVNPEDPEGLDQEVQEQQQGQVYQEFFLHGIMLRKTDKIT